MLPIDELTRQLYNRPKKIYGPYVRADGRKHVVLWYGYTGSNITLSYPKYLLERHLCRVLVEPETVDHIDGNFTNDSIDNLRVLHRAQNASDYPAKRKAFLHSKICVNCHKEFKHRDKRVRFCHKICAGKYQHKK